MAVTAATAAAVEMDDRLRRCLYVGEPSITEYTLPGGKALVTPGKLGPIKFDGGRFMRGLNECETPSSGMAL